MSHVAVRLLADRFAHATEGVNYWTSRVPRFEGDRVPADAAIYDETRDDWVARGAVPRGSDGDEPLIEFPAWILFLQRGDYPSGIPADTDSGARVIAPTITVIAQLVLKDVDSALAVSDGMYMMRGARGVIMRFDDPQITFDDAREACGMRLMPSLGVQQGQVKGFQEDKVMSPGALVITYPTLETVPLDPL